MQESEFVITAFVLKESRKGTKLIKNVVHRMDNINMLWFSYKLMIFTKPK